MSVGAVGTLWIALRAVIWASGFVALWAWLAYQAHLASPPFGVYLPDWIRPIGLVLMPVGAVLALWSIAAFVVRGRGTAAPFDPPREFVAAGPYRFVRNPMYVGGFLCLAGWALWVASFGALLIAFAMLVAAHLFVLLYEEPALERRFGDAYRAYRRRTPRWVTIRPWDRGEDRRVSAR